MTERIYHFLSVTVEVSCHDLDLLALLDRDFGFFAASTGRFQEQRQIKINLETQELSRKHLPDVSSSQITPRYIIYKDGESRWIEYYEGRAYCHWNFQTNSGTIWSTDQTLLHELTYLVILSRVGEALDQLGLHRVHAGGFAKKGKGFILVLPSGGGKTTLTTQLMHLDNTVKLISDDTPIITDDGRLHAFPCRLGFTSKPEGFTDDDIRPFFRAEHGLKWLVDLSSFDGRIQASCPLEGIIIGRRSLTAPAYFSRVHKIRVMKDIFSSLVVGVGLPQLVEFILCSSPRELWRFFRSVCFRMKTAISIILTAKTYEIGLGPDINQNTRCLSDLVEEHFQTGTH